MTFTSLPIDVF